MTCDVATGPTVLLVVSPDRHPAYCAAGRVARILERHRRQIRGSVRAARLIHGSVIQVVVSGYGGVQVFTRRVYQLATVVEITVAVGAPVAHTGQVGRVIAVALDC